MLCMCALFEAALWCMIMYKMHCICSLYVTLTASIQPMTNTTKKVKQQVLRTMYLKIPLQVTYDTDLETYQ